MSTVLEKDIARYGNRKEMPLFQVYYRRLQNSRGGLIESFIRFYSKYVETEIMLNFMRIRK